MTILQLVVMSAVVYRVTRFTQLDSMFEDTRDRLVFWLSSRRTESTGRTGTAYRKAVDLVTCAFCVSIWIAALAVLWLAWASNYTLTRYSIAETLAVATGAMAFYRYIDPPE